MNICGVKERFSGALQQLDETNIKELVYSRSHALTYDELLALAAYCEEQLNEYPNLMNEKRAYTLVAESLSIHLMHSKGYHQYTQEIVDVLNQYPWILSHHCSFYFNFFELNQYRVSDALLINVIKHLRDQFHFNAPSEYKRLQERCIALHPDPWFLLGTEYLHTISPRHFCAWRNTHNIAHTEMSQAAKIVGYFIDEYSPQSPEETFLFDELADFPLADALHLAHKKVEYMHEIPLHM